MASLTAKAQRKNKLAPDSRPRFSLEIADDEWRGRIYGCEAIYTADGGTSEMTFETPQGYLSAASLQDAPVRLRLGYGTDLAEWFTGALEKTEEGEPVAWGPFKLLSEQKFIRQTSYEGQTLDEAILDICDRAGYPGGTIEVRGGSQFTLGRKARFPGQTSLGSGLSSLLRSADFVGPDRPGREKVFMPRPRPGATARHVASYDEDHYPPEDGFVINRSRRGFYARVLIKSHLPDGTLAFPPVDVPVEARGRFRPPANRAYVISNFKGDSEEALETALGLSRKLERGTIGYTLSGISANPDLNLYEPIECEGVEEEWAGGRTPERYRVRLDCQIDGEIRAQCSREAISMSLSGRAVEAGRRLLLRRFYVSRGVSPVVGASP